jgi:predicted AAA+ superfamily ATPase
MLRRKITAELLKWKNADKRVALLVKGARQVGKSTSIKLFAKEYYKHFVIVDFIEHADAAAAFDGNLNADTIIRKLSALGYGPFVEGETLVFFDEIQMCPNARTAIKYLVQDGRYDFIESGSLLGINYKEIKSIPVGFEREIEMFPLDFDEYLWAKNVGDDVLRYLKSCCDGLTPVDGFTHEQVMKHFREYMYIGGMPSVVNIALKNPDIAASIGEQHALMVNYRDDISHYADKEKTLAKNMFDAIPAQLAKVTKRFILADIEKHASSDKYKDAAQWLIDAGVAYQCFQLSALELPLQAQEKRNLYKLYLLDTGLLCSEMMDGIQSAILFDNLAVNEGSVTENIVAATLVKNGKPLYYYDKSSRAELDFCFKDGSRVSIIEVKSGKEYKKHAALDKAAEVFGDKLNRRIVLSKYNVEVDTDGVIYLPLYMAMFL